MAVFFPSSAVFALFTTGWRNKNEVHKEGSLMKSENVKSEESFQRLAFHFYWEIYVEINLQLASGFNHFHSFFIPLVSLLNSKFNFFSRHFIVDSVIHLHSVYLYKRMGCVEKNCSPPLFNSIVQDEKDEEKQKNGEIIKQTGKKPGMRW